MNLKRFSVFFLVLSLIFSITNHPFKPAVAMIESTVKKSQKELLSQSGFFFTENKGQWNPDILFVGDTSFGKIAFAIDAIYYEMIKMDVNENKGSSQNLSFENLFNQKKTFQSQIVKLSFLKPLTPKVQGVDILPQYNNYFIGNDPSKWTTDCHNYAKVSYQDVWQGIDLVYFYTTKGLKYEYYVEPEANFQNLQIKVEGADLTAQTKSLQIATALGNIMDANLKVFDQISGSVFESSFVVQNNVLSFQDIPEKRENPIVIDPLIYSTFLGGTENDTSHSIALDSEGNAFVCGETISFDFPTTPGSIEKSNSGNLDIFVSKLNSAGNTLLYSTYLGGNAEEYASCVAVDLEGNAYICGETKSLDFPTAPDKAIQSTNKGELDAFVVKMNPGGKTLLYSTYLGGTSNDSANGIAVDATSNVYITGYTMSKNFPVTKGSYQSETKGNRDVFVVKLNLISKTLVYSTYLGGSDWDFAYKITTDAKGSAYICGETYSNDFPTTIGSVQAEYNNNKDAFVVKMNPSGDTLLYSTYLGGSDYEYADGIAVDKEGIAYITGLSNSIDFPTTAAVFRSFIFGDSDAFITKLNESGTTLIFSTYIGGYGYDRACGIALDNQGNVFITGFTSSIDFPVTSSGYQSSNIGNFDVFVSKLDPTGIALLYSTYLGGSDRDYSYSIAVDAMGDMYITGMSYSDNFPNALYTNQFSNNGKADVFVAKLSPPIIIELWIGRIYAIIESNYVYIDVAPMIITGRAFVPLRFITEAYGAKVIWDNETRSIQITFDDTKITMKINDRKVVVNNNVLEVDAPPMIVQNRTLVPIRFIAEALGAKVSWEAQEQRITITLENRKKQL